MDPGTAELELNATVGVGVTAELTVKGDGVEESPLEPVAAILYDDPGATLATMNEAVKTPLAIEHV